MNCKISVYVVKAYQTHCPHRVMDGIRAQYPELSGRPEEDVASEDLP
jgi:hypothetical protein